MHRFTHMLKDLGKAAASFPLAGTQHPGTPEHADQCADCAAAFRRQRQYLERLRDAAVPAVSDDLTERLLLRTRELAAAPPAPASRTAPFKLAGLAAGGAAMVTAGAVAAGAYMAAGDPPQYAAASFSGESRDTLQSGDSAKAGETGQAGLPLKATGGAPAADAAGGTPTDALVASLRSRGWACPDLGSMGFHVVSAASKTYAGQAAVELRLSDGTHTATVLEQHTAAGGNAGLQGTAPDTAPVNPLTGHAATEDGFVAVDEPIVAGSGTGDGRLWVKASPPWSAIYQTARSTFTYVSDLPANVADDALAVLSAADGAWSRSGGNHVRGEDGVLEPGVSAAADFRPSAGSAGSEEVTERLQRGLRKMALQLDYMTGHSDR
ncbi:hypothetical protein ACIP9X_06295 [Arthrobacter sp. NPDC093125]|uniref:hypothetical protein n=1 Tax=Arthrobacter sp. NPDC093125 TaxID=3363944 RepID=UPI0037FF42BF